MITDHPPSTFAGSREQWRVYQMDIFTTQELVRLFDSVTEDDNPFIFISLMRYRKTCKELLELFESGEHNNLYIKRKYIECSL